MEIKSEKREPKEVTLRRALPKKVGMHRTYIGMIERAEKNITLVNINRIAKALNMELSDLLEFKR